MKVGVIDPGGYKSKIREKVAMYSITGSDNLDQNITEDQQAAIQQMKDANAKLKDPDEVAEAVMHFIASDAPRMRYMVPPTENSAQSAIRTTLGRVVQLNAGQPYEMSRDELIGVLDEILAEQGQSQTASD